MAATKAYLDTPSFIFFIAPNRLGASLWRALPQKLNLQVLHYLFACIAMLYSPQNSNRLEMSEFVRIL